MNERLKILFEQYEISEKNRFEITQIFNLLSDQKRLNLLNNFDKIALKISNIEKSVSIEKDILIGDAVERIRNSILEKRNKKINQKIEEEMNLLREGI